MPTIVDTTFYKNKKSMNFYFALGFLLIVILGTLGLYFYNSNVIRTTSELESEISRIEKSIDEVQSDPLVTIYNVYSQNKKLLDTKALESQIPLFVSHLKKNFIKYWVEAKGFAYTWGEITTSLSNQTTDNGYAFEKVVRFLREYPQDEKALFDINMIESFEGYDRIWYETTFVLR